MVAQVESMPSMRLPTHIGGPRGFLRIYILYQLTKRPMSGYDLISELSTLTSGTWRPGSGSIYPILEDLKGMGLIEPVSKGKRSKLVYSVTKKGRTKLAEDSKMINKMVYEFATRYNKIRIAMAGLVSADNLSTLVIELFKSNRTLWDSILESKELSESEVRLRLKEYSLLLDDESQWVKRHLRSPSKPEGK